MTENTDANDSEQRENNHRGEFTDANGDLTLTDDVKDAITVREDQHAGFTATHEPTGITDEYTVQPFARGMNGNALRDVARRQLARDHSEVLDHHRTEAMTDGGEEVEFADDQLDRIASALMQNGVTAGAVERVMADLSGAEQPDGSEYVSPTDTVSIDVPTEVMNLARHLYAESRNLGTHVADSEKGHGNELASAIYQARADGIMDACNGIRELSLWLEGERDRPASLIHGEELAAEGKRVPNSAHGVDK